MPKAPVPPAAMGAPPSGVVTATPASGLGLPLFPLLQAAAVIAASGNTASGQALEVKRMKIPPGAAAFAPLPQWTAQTLRASILRLDDAVCLARSDGLYYGAAA